MTTEITVTIQADITLIATKEEERIIEEREVASLVDNDEEYDKLTDKLNKSVRERLNKIYGNDYCILDINWN